MIKKIREHSDEKYPREACPRTTIINVDVYRKDPQSQQLCSIYSEYEDRLRSMLDGEALELFARYIKAQAEVSQMNETDRFIYGYRLGVLMTMEVFNGK